MPANHVTQPRWTSWLDLLLPSHCILCGSFCGLGRLCQQCTEELPRPGQSCRMCALAGMESDLSVCGACLAQRPAWDEAVAALVYEYPADQLVQRFKFQRSLACGQLLADELILAVSRSTVTRPDLLLPVPLHFSRRFWRGFNQAEFLARQLGQALEIPVRVNRLRRRRKTTAQSGLDRSARRKNLGGAFSCNALTGKAVALVDDVMTTGATLSECTRVVRSAGAAHVSVWVAARVPARGL